MSRKARVGPIPTPGTSFGSATPSFGWYTSQSVSREDCPAVRNLERAGVPRAAAMKMVGHKTESIYKRYSIVDHSMLILGADLLDRAQKQQVAELQCKPAEGGADASVVH